MEEPSAKRKRISQMKINHKDWLPIRKFVSLFDVVMLITDKGTSKSYTGMDLCIEHMLKGGHCAILKNTEVELERSLINPMKAKMVEQGLIVKGVNEPEDFDKKVEVMYSCNKQGIYKDGVIMMQFVYMSRLDSFAGSEIKADFIFGDEFIAGNEVEGKIKELAINHLDIRLKKLMRTLTRPHKKYKLLMAANPHCLESDVINMFNLDFDGDKLAKGEDQIIGKKLSYQHNLLAVGCSTPFDIPLLHDNDAFNNAIFETATEQFRYLPNSFKRIIPYTKEKLDGMHFQPDFMLYWQGEHYALGSFDAPDGKPGYYVHQCQYNDYQCDIIAIDTQDVTSLTKLYLDPKVICKWFAKLTMFRLDHNRVWVDTCFTKELVTESGNSIIDDTYNLKKEQGNQGR